MSADTLRRAAALMREDHALSTGHDSLTCASTTCRRRAFHHAVAEWLNATADDWDRSNAPIPVSDIRLDARAALAVARTYLGEQS